MSKTTTVKIPASVTHDHAFAYGYLTTSFRELERVIKNTDENDLRDLQYAFKRLKEQVESARALDAEMSRRADERWSRLLEGNTTEVERARELDAEMYRRADHRMGRLPGG